MIKRRSTLDHSERIRKNREVQTFAILDLCLQIPVDERLIIRKKIKEGNHQLAQRIYECKKGKNLHQLQVYLRKYIHAFKNSLKFRYNSFNSKDRTSNRYNLQQAYKNVKTEGSRNNSLRSSLQTSPQNKNNIYQFYRQFNPSDLQKHIENQIDREIYFGVHNEDCTDECRGITPREEQPSQIESESQSKSKQQTNQSNGLLMSIKQLLLKRTKHEQRTCRNLEISRIFTKGSKFKGKQNRLQIVARQPVRVTRDLSDHSKFGQFYKRIKLTIEEQI